VFNWTNEDVLNWLELYVKLPKYSDAFKKNKVTGRQLPSIAINSGQILQNGLFITDGQDKQKIQLRAMDVILFGPPVYHGHWKDAVLKLCACLIVCVTIYAFWQRKLSKARIDSFIEDLRVKEEEIKILKSKFDDLGNNMVDCPRDQNQEDDNDLSLPIMMPSTPTSSSSSDDDSPPSSNCKYVSVQSERDFLNV